MATPTPTSALLITLLGGSVTIADTYIAAGKTVDPKVWKTAVAVLALGGVMLAIDNATGSNLGTIMAGVFTLGVVITRGPDLFTKVGTYFTT